VVISYYLISLLKLAMDAVQESGVSFNKPLILGIAIPVVLTLVFLGVRRIHYRFIRMAKNQ
jgi:uncharacterized membrane-anchored protein